jgi:serine/threonine-protein kinase RsbW
MTESGAFTLSLPASTAHLGTARSVAAEAAVAAELDITQVEDVRLIVDEAFAALVPDAPAASSVTCVFTPGPRGLSVLLSAPSTSGAAPDRSTFGWTIMSALADDLSADVVDGVVTLGLTVPRTTDA